MGRGGWPVFGFWTISFKIDLLPRKKIRGRSKKVRTTRGVIFRQGSERICLDKSVKNQQKHMSTNILKMSLNRCPDFALKIPLCGLSNFCVMFLCVSRVFPPWGTPGRNISFLGEVRVFTSLHLAPKSHQSGSHPNPLPSNPNCTITRSPRQH